MQLISLVTSPDALQALMALAIASTAVPLLWPSRSRPSPAPTRPDPQRAAPPPSLQRPPLPVTIQPQAAFARVATYLDTTGERVRNVHGATLAASRHIDNAEMALLRLIREAAPYMANPVTRSVSPAR